MSESVGGSPRPPDDSGDPWHNWFYSGQGAEDEAADTDMLICQSGVAYCQYNDGSGDDGFPAFALIRIDGEWAAVCAMHAQAAAAGEMEANWIPDPEVPA